VILSFLSVIIRTLRIRLAEEDRDRIRRTRREKRKSWENCRETRGTGVRIVRVCTSPRRRSRDFVYSCTHTFIVVIFLTFERRDIVSIYPNTFGRVYCSFPIYYKSSAWDDEKRAAINVRRHQLPSSRKLITTSTATGETYRPFITIAEREGARAPSDVIFLRAARPPALFGETKRNRTCRSGIDRCTIIISQRRG